MLTGTENDIGLNLSIATTKQTTHEKLSVEMCILSSQAQFVVEYILNLVNLTVGK